LVVRPGPNSVLTDAEEVKIVDYVIELSIIGYDRTREANPRNGEAIH